MSNQTTGLSMEDRSSKTIYLSVFDGKFAQRVKEGTEGAYSRPLSKGENIGKLVWENYYNRISGTIINVSRKESNGFGSFWDFKIKLDGSELIAVLTLPITSQLASQIINRIPNINLSKSCLLEIWKFKDQGTDKDGKEKKDAKEVVAITVKQNDIKIAPFYLSENLPPLKEIMLNGKKTYDSTDRIIFYEKILSDIFTNQRNKEMAEELKSKASVSTSELPGSVNRNSSEDMSRFDSAQDDSDDLPF